MSDFTLAGYGALLSDLNRRGYRCATFHDAKPSGRDLILRHDIDFSLNAALPMAETEAALGHAATYFVLIRSEMYNIHTPRARVCLATLLEQGHEVGLHFDASLYGDDRDELERAASAECAVLEAATGCAVRVISFHRPARHLLDDDESLAGRVHAYQTRFFRDMGYCSDSRGAWHHGNPLDHSAVKSGTALQLLTHPIWWTSEFPGRPVATLDAFRVRRDHELAREISENCDPYRAEFLRTLDQIHSENK